MQPRVKTNLMLIQHCHPDPPPQPPPKGYKAHRILKSMPENEIHDRALQESFRKLESLLSAFA